MNGILVKYDGVFGFVENSEDRKRYFWKKPSGDYFLHESRCYEQDQNGYDDVFHRK